MPRVDRSTIWPYDAQGEPREFFYSRYAHPTGAEAEARLGERENGHALLFASAWRPIPRACWRSRGRGA
jgi:hypothetical protein